MTLSCDRLIRIRHVGFTLQRQNSVSVLTHLDCVCVCVCVCVTTFALIVFCANKNVVYHNISSAAELLLTRWHHRCLNELVVFTFLIFLVDERVHVVFYNAIGGSGRLFVSLMSSLVQPWTRLTSRLYSVLTTFSVYGISSLIKENFTFSSVFVTSSLKQ